jgi:hypothetical protein
LFVRVKCLARGPLAGRLSASAGVVFFAAVDLAAAAFIAHRT